MHQPSAPTRDYGAPPLPITSARTLPPRGRCAECLQPITPDQPSTHVPTTRTFTGPVPYQHRKCPQ